MGDPFPTNTWDKLQHLTKVAYPDGTLITYTYTNLDMVKVVDRLGNTTSYGYDSMRRKIAETNALNNVTRYSYCSCGSLESIQDALNQSTYFSYDTAGRLTNTLYPDGFSVNRSYYLSGKPKILSDSSGTIVKYYFDTLLRQVAVTNVDSGGTAIGGVSASAYDINDLVTNQVDANGVSVDMTYDALHRLRTRSYPDGGVEKFGYALNVSGMTSYTNQLGKVWRYAYDPLSRKTAETNANSEVTQFTYSRARDLLTLTDGKSQTTTWGYDTFGRVTNKVDAASNLIFAYSYDANNRLTNRWTPAKGNTAYSYDAVGNLLAIHYPTSPAISFTYDALNRPVTMVDAVGTTAYGYDAAGQVLSEDGPWANDTVSFTYQNRLRTGLNIAAANTAWMQTYGYDAMKRLTSITSPAGAFGYQYAMPAMASRLVQNIALPGGGSITNAYDANARLLSTELLASDLRPLDSYAYGYNQGNQRTNVVRTEGDFVNYAYDDIGQLKTAKAKESGGSTTRLMEQFGYVYDAAGNLNTRTNNALVQSFNVNNLNQLTTATRSGTMTVEGSTTITPSSVTVNGSSATLYGDNTFAKDGFSLSNGTNTFTAIATDSYGRYDTNVSISYLPATNFFAYDLNGNMLTNGNEVLVWNDENELVTNYVPGSWKSEFVYDGKLRRRIQRDYSWNPNVGTWTRTNEIRFIYDGSVIVQHRDANNLPVLTLTRGLDLSGSWQGAGGIGGLLAITEDSLSAIGSPQSASLYHCDGNGNVTCLIQTNGSIVAKALYDPFGNLLSVSGPKASINPYWFSSKPVHWPSGKFDYGMRWYLPSLQRWVSLDPAGEIDGPNLYMFVRNSCIDRYDLFGFFGCSRGPCDDPCGDAKKQGLDNDDVAGVVCCGGKAYVCIWDSGGGRAKNNKAKSIIDECVKQHENAHLPDITCPSGNKLSRGAPPPGVSSKPGECKAYKVEANCYRSSISKCDGDPQCISDVLRELKYANQQIKANCGP